MPEAEHKPPSMSAEEWDARVELAACYRLTDLYGWSDLTATHISVRVPGEEERFLLNPFGMMFDEITASSLIKVDMEGNVVEAAEFGMNNAGFVIHSAIHRSSADLVCVMHTHTVANVAISMQQDGLLPENLHALIVYGDVAYHEFEGPATRIDERERIVSSLGDKRILVLRNHGMMTVGRTIGEAFLAMYHVEMACRIQLAFQSSGARLSPVPQHVKDYTIDRSRKAFWSGGIHDPDARDWPALLRKLDRHDPSYRS